MPEDFMRRQYPIPSKDGKYHADFVQHIKSVERIAITSVLQSKVMILSGYKASLDDQLQQFSMELEKYAKETYATNIKEGLTGKTAEAAENYLVSLERPELGNPINIG